MTTKRGPRAGTVMRAQELVRFLARGASRAGLRRYAAEQWGVAPRTVDEYLALARQMLRDDWRDVERSQMLAELLSWLSSLQMEARRTGQLHVALGRINTAAKLVKLCA